MSRNNIARQYNRKDDDPAPASPSGSVVIDADDDSRSFHEDLDEPNRSEVVEVDDGWDSDDAMFEKRIYDSPRLLTEDHEIFPPPETHVLYQEAEQRWRKISEAAGSHRQDGSRLVIRRSMKPATLRFGIVSQFVGRRVRCLSLWLDYKEDILPQWLDAIVDLFPNLQELSISQDDLYNEDEVAVSARMRRLYVLYRIPNLLCIDGEPVQQTERELARPATPIGARVQQNNWMQKENVSTSTVSEPEDQESLHAFDSLQIQQIVSIGSNTAMDLCEDFALLTSKVAVVHSHNETFSNDTIFEDADSLFGEDLIGPPATSIPQLSCEARQDLGSSSRDEVDQKQCASHAVKSNSQVKRIADPVFPPPPPPLQPPSCAKSKNQQPSQHPSTKRNKRVAKQTSAPTRDGSGLHDSYELVSVASSHHEWTAACGVLSFRSDRACAPRLRLNFLGLNRRQVTGTKNGENCRGSPCEADLDSHRDSLTPMLRLRLQKDQAIRDAVTDPKRSRNEVPQNPEVTLSRSANQIVPPAKSLTSPFPMQFRERKSSLHISTSAKDLSESQTDATMLAAPRARGSVALDTITKPTTLTVLCNSMTVQVPKVSDSSKVDANHVATRDSKSTKNGLPPPCPGASRRKVVAASLLQRDPVERKAARIQRRMDRQRKLFQLSARSSSMMDCLDDEDSSDSDEGTIVHHDENVVLDSNVSTVHEGNQW
jgi:hypothetical protein